MLVGAFSREFLQPWRGVRVHCVEEGEAEADEVRVGPGRLVAMLGDLRRRRPAPEAALPGDVNVGNPDGGGRNFHFRG